MRKYKKDDRDDRDTSFEAPLRCPLVAPGGGFDLSATPERALLAVSSKDAILCAMTSRKVVSFAPFNLVLSNIFNIASVHIGTTLQDSLSCYEVVLDHVLRIHTHTHGLSRTAQFSTSDGKQSLLHPMQPMLKAPRPYGARCRSTPPPKDNTTIGISKHRQIAEITRIKAEVVSSSNSSFSNRFNRCSSRSSASRKRSGSRSLVVVHVVAADDYDDGC